MNPAYSVILFTTASGAGYGLLALLGLVGYNHGQASSLGFGLVSMVVALGLITVGLLSSTLHLGHPERAWRALSQWRSSWLSREGVAAVLTYMPAAAFGLVWSGLIEAPRLIAPLGIVTAVMCAVTVACTGQIYASLRTIRAWRQPLTTPVYLAFGLATGSVLLAAIAALFGRFQFFLGTFTLVALALAGILKIVYWVMLDRAPRDLTIEQATGLGAIGAVSQWEVPHTNINFVQKEMGFVVARRHAAKLRRIVLALLLASMLAMVASFSLPVLSVLAALAALAAAVTERWLFFAEAQHAAMLYYGNARA